MAPGVEQAMVDSGIILIKYWLEVGEAEQTKRLQSRIDNPGKIWKLSDMDLKSYSRWYDYARARDEMFEATDTRVGALARRPHRRQAPGSAQPDHPPAHPGGVHHDTAEAGRLPTRPAPRRVRGAAVAGGPRPTPF